MEYTKNYHLPQWAETDRIMMEDFNAAMESIESGISQALTTAEEGQTALAESIGASLESITSNLGSGGQTARIAWGNYTGTGTFGQNKPTSFSFDFKPIIMLFCEVDTRNTPSSTFLIRPNSYAESTGSNTMTVTWSEKGVSFYCSVSETGQCNTQGCKYGWIAIGTSA